MVLDAIMSTLDLVGHPRESLPRGCPLRLQRPGGLFGGAGDRVVVWWPGRKWGERWEGTKVEVDVEAVVDGKDPTVALKLASQEMLLKQLLVEVRAIKQDHCFLKHQLARVESTTRQNLQVLEEVFPNSWTQRTTIIISMSSMLLTIPGFRLRLFGRLLELSFISESHVSLHLPSCATHRITSSWVRIMCTADHGTDTGSHTCIYSRPRHQHRIPYGSPQNWHMGLHSSLLHRTNWI